jgi:uncharacterized protein YbdZ (MbtH family)
MTNPFEDEDGSYLVLANQENQHSLWPAAMPVPAGWEIRHQADSRAASLEYVETHWTDLRPASLAAALG